MTTEELSLHDLAEDVPNQNMGLLYARGSFRRYTYAVINRRCEFVSVLTGHADGDQMELFPCLDGFDYVG